MAWLLDIIVAVVGLKGHIEPARRTVRPDMLAYAFVDVALRAGLVVQCKAILGDRPVCTSANDAPRLWRGQVFNRYLAPWSLVIVGVEGHAIPLSAVRQRKPGQREPS